MTTAVVEKEHTTSVPLSERPWSRMMTDLRQQTGLDAFPVDRLTGKVLDEGALPPWLPETLRHQLSQIEKPVVIESAGGLTAFAFPFRDAPDVLAIGYQLDRGCAAPAELIVAASRAGWPQRRFDRWLSEHPRCSPGPLKALLSLAFRTMSERVEQKTVSDQVDQLSEQLDLAYEEVALLHSLTRNLQVSRHPGDLAELCLDRMPDLIEAQGHVIHLCAPGESPGTWRSGEPPLNDRELSEFFLELDSRNSYRPIVLNHLAATEFSRRHKDIKSLVAAPVREGKRKFGWIVSLNKQDDQEFGTVEANFINTLATILGTHVRNKDLLREQNDLLLGFVRSFVSSLDAKDPYTRGHSERVALIARCIGREMGLPDEELKTLHLSGLLHDIGKIGVDDRILRKDGWLSDEEFEQVKRHPMIGYKILAGLKNLHHVLPGVRSHHESYNGKGYPDGLAKDEIPLLARILAVADSYDAMGSDRPYRKGLPIEKIHHILREGSGSQWDPSVIDAYFRCQVDIRSICTAYSLESGSPLEGEISQPD